MSGIILHTRTHGRIAVLSGRAVLFVREVDSGNPKDPVTRVHFDGGIQADVPGTFADVVGILSGEPPPGTGVDLVPAGGPRESNAMDGRDGGRSRFDTRDPR